MAAIAQAQFANYRWATLSGFGGVVLQMALHRGLNLAFST
jgi:hypothetical protein